ncbi:MAG: hypothetical protein H6838_13725 [Planctomycetes bacterium]|nr:hypothetical protein [Planctomycetota bacterium]MCB9886548.1 hypothetical protein [Planctomycetota bacterium]
MVAHRVCYDSLRQRYVGLDTTGRTWELGGASWSARPVYAPFSVQQGLTLVFTGLTVAVVPDAPTQPMTTWGFDGVQWSQFAATNPPVSRTDANFAWDPVHGVLVMFGGEDPWLGTALDETWTFDGANWVHHTTTVAPPGRNYAAVAVDPVRQRLVMYGGYNSQLGPLDDTWEWDGASWQQQNPATVPPARNHAAMAYDPVRGRCVMYGGFGPTMPSPTELWEYDGVNWTQVAQTGAQPGWRMGHSLVFDDRLGEVVVVGGYEGSYPQSSAATSSWSWNGIRWLQQAALGDAPSARIGASLIAEPGMAGAILFSGADPQRMLTDTWRWDGAAWSELQVAGPPARAHAASCTTPSGAWVFGGGTGVNSFVYLGDTWRWDGTAWSQLAATGPSPRANSSMAFDVARSVAVLFGGYDTTVHGDTWTFDGVSWLQRSPATSPPPRFGHSMAYDPTTGFVVLFGGLDANLQPLTDTWVWDGTSWSQRSPVSSPTNTGYCSMQFDLLRQRPVLLTGPPQGGAASAWEFDGLTWTPIPLAVPRLYPYGTQTAVAPGGRGVLAYLSGSLHQLSSEPAEVETYGSSCGVGAPQLSARTWPTLGANFGLDCIDNDPNSPVAFAGAFTRANIPVGGCTLLVTPGLALTVQMSNSGGFAHQAMALPPWPGLLGLDLCFQAASLRASAPGGFVLSRGLALTIGD